MRWESDLDLTLRDVARSLNVSAPTVTNRAKRELWVKSEVIEPKRLNYTPKELVEISIRALVRAATQTQDIASSVKAAGLLLDRTMGRVVTPAQPMLAEALPEPQESEPQEVQRWLNRFSQARPEPEPPQDTAEATPEPPAASEPPARAISPPSGDSKLVPDTSLPRLHVVQAEPKFYDAPGVPAVGPYRDPTRLN